MPKHQEWKKQKKEEIENADFESYYSNILQLLRKVQEPIKLGVDPIAALGLIPIFQERLEMCNTIQSQLNNQKHKNRLFKKLVNSISYRDEFSKRHGMGILKEWEISVFADPITNKYTLEKIVENIHKQINSYKFKWNKAIKSINDSASFQKTIEAIPSVEIMLSETVYAKKPVSELEELVKYSNITSKTSFDRIGSFVVVDTETTGLSSTRDNIIELAAIKFEDWIPIAKFHTLINPKKHIPDDASAVNGITDEMVAEAPTFSQIIESLIDFVGKFSLVGHNLPFDLKFLYRYGYDFTTEKRRYFDTCEIAKKTLKKPKMKWDKEYGEYVINDNYDYDVEDYKLTTLCDYYGIRDNTFAHRALSDALATGLLFKKLAQDKID
ncbi:MAG: 3'-5' exonuclease [Clostridiaceae bacterium]|nr:3'-5' exonuclease [Clostridiaceae bacterium]